MEIVISYKGVNLIRKYEHYYIRFESGQKVKHKCDLAITEEEANSVIVDNTKIREILEKYKNNMSWILETFVDSAIKDYMFYECNMSEVVIEGGMEKLNRHKDIKLELYNTLMNERFPESNAIEAEGYTAKEINESTYLSILGAYNYLIYLREDPENAINYLEMGLPRM